MPLTPPETPPELPHTGNSYTETRVGLGEAALAENTTGPISTPNDVSLITIRQTPGAPRRPTRFVLGVGISNCFRRILRTARTLHEASEAISLFSNPSFSKDLIKICCAALSCRAMIADTKRSAANSSISHGRMISRPQTKTEPAKRKINPESRGTLKTYKQAPFLLA